MRSPFFPMLVGFNIGNVLSAIVFAASGTVPAYLLVAWWALGVVALLAVVETDHWKAK